MSWQTYTVEFTNEAGVHVEKYVVEQPNGAAAVETAATGLRGAFIGSATCRGHDTGVTLKFNVRKPE